MLSLLLFGIILTIILVHIYLQRNFKYWIKKKIPGQKPLPYFGTIKDVILAKKHIATYLKDCYDSYKTQYVGIFFCDEPVLVVRDPKLLKHILVQNFGHFFNRVYVNPEHNDLYKNVLFFQTGEKWKESRNKISVVFTNSKMKHLFEEIKHVGTKLNKHILENEGILDAAEVGSKYSTDVTMKVFFDVQSGCLEHDDAVFIEISDKIMAPTLLNIFSQYAYMFKHSLVDMFKLEFFDKGSITFFVDIFWKAVRARDEVGSKSMHFIDMLRELRTNDQLFNEMKMSSSGLQFFVAGTETTGALLAFSLYEMGMNLAVQNKLREEIRNKFPNVQDITFTGIKELKYLDMCVSEALRKYPVLAHLDRRCVKAFRVPGSDFIIEKGTPILVPILGFHYDERYFPQPEKFIPERFLNKVNSEQLIYFPFGAGPRFCLGQRLGFIATKAALVYILHEFEVEKDMETPIKITFDPKHFILKSKDALKIRFKKINVR